MTKISTKTEILDFFRSKNINYLSEYILECQSFDNINFYSSEYYLDNLSEFTLLEKEYGEFIRTNFMADVYIKKSDKSGYGLFNNTKLNKGSFVGIYYGIIRAEDEMVAYDENGYDTDYAWDFPDEIEGFPALEINGKYSGNEMRFANHDLNPNISVEHTVVDNVWYIFFIASCDISSDTELTISYGEAYWDTEYRQLN